MDAALTTGRAIDSAPWIGTTPRLRAATEERAWVRWTCITVTVAVLTLLLFVPLASIFAEALKKGVGTYFASFKDPNAWAAIWLTLVATGISVPLNLVFGLAAAWAIAKFDFRGKSLVVTLIDL